MFCSRPALHQYFSSIGTKLPHYPLRVIMHDACSRASVRNNVRGIVIFWQRLKVKQLEGDITFTFRITNENDLHRVMELYEELQNEAKLLNEPKVQGIDKTVSGGSALKSKPQTPVVKPRQDTYREIIQEIKKAIGDKHFGRRQAERITLRTSGYGESTVRDALNFGMAHRMVFLLQRSPKHVYSFIEPSVHTLKPEGALDLISDESVGLIDALRVVERISPALVLLVSNHGIEGRTSDAEKTCVVDLKIGRSLFSSYHVDKPVTFGIDVKAMLERLGSVRKGEKLHLFIHSVESNALLKVGAIGREYDFKLLELANTTDNFDKLTLPGQKAEFVISRKEFSSLLADAAVNAPYVDFIHEANKTIVINVSARGEFRRELQSECIEPTKSRYLIANLLNCIKGQLSCELIAVRDYSELLAIELTFQEHVKQQFMIANMRTTPNDPKCLMSDA